MVDANTRAIIAAVKTSIASRQPKKKKFHRAKRTIPLTVAAPVAMSFFVEPAQGWGAPLALAQEGRWKDFGNVLVKGWTGWNVSAGKWDGIPPYLAMVTVGALAHKGAGMLGLNKIMAKLPAPFNKVSI